VAAWRSKSVAKCSGSETDHMIGLRKVIESHPLMSGVADRVHAVPLSGRPPA
jgi:hypothetical protein